MPQPALLALEDGQLFWGQSIGSDGGTVGEVVFNTAMTGYQEILTDPSYCRQIVTITTLSGAEAAVRAIRLTNQTIQVRSIQEYHR